MPFARARLPILRYIPVSDSPPPLILCHGLSLPLISRTKPPACLAGCLPVCLSVCLPARTCIERRNRAVIRQTRHLFVPLKRLDPSSRVIRAIPILGRLY